MSIKLKGSSDGSVSFDAPADTSPSGSDITLTLPTSAGSADQFLKNSGIAGELEYSSMVEDSSGNVGIGTTSPNGKLGISDGTGSLSSTQDITAEFRRDDGTNNPRLQIRHSTAGTDLHHTYSTGAANFTFSNGGSERLRITSGGVILINAGSQNAGEKLRVNGSGSSGNVANFHFESTDDRANLIMRHDRASGSTSAKMIAFERTGGTEVGSITSTGGATSFNTSSDYRLKENVVDLDGAISRVKQLAPKRFNFIADDSTTVDGFLAHEAATVVPEAVTGIHNQVDDDDNPVYQGIDQSKLVPLLTAALQEAIAKIETLETKVAALEAA